jgi:hypothetical protein
MRDKTKKSKENITFAEVIESNAAQKVILHNNHSSLILHDKTAETSTTALTPIEVEIDKIVSNMKLEANKFIKTMKEEEAQFNTKIKPAYDNLDSFYDNFLEEQIMMDNLLEEALQATIAREEISFDLKKALIDM